MKRVVVIPARLASTRLPEKPLRKIAGVPMVVRVAQQAAAADVDDVVVAVDDQRVLDCVRQAGFRAVMTALDHASGSDRVAEVAMQLELAPDDVLINVQGDEPLIPPSVISGLAHAFATVVTSSNSSSSTMATLSEPLTTVRDFMDQNVVKVVVDREQRALYFSRASIPLPRDVWGTDQLTDATVTSLGMCRHVGVYAFTAASIQAFVDLPVSSLEQVERLEQLRWLEAGRALWVFPSAEPIPGGVDTPADLQRVEQHLLQQ